MNKLISKISNLFKKNGIKSITTDINRKKSISKGIIDATMLLGLIGCFISTTVFEKSQEAIRNGGNLKMCFIEEHYIV